MLKQFLCDAHFSLKIKNDALGNILICATFQVNTCLTIIHEEYFAAVLKTQRTIHETDIRARNTVINNH